MRAAWRVFDGAFKASKTKKLRRHLERLADRLGAVRDLDVLIEGVEAYSLMLDEEERPGLEPLLSVWRRQRRAARTQLIGELDSDRYATFVKEMDAFLEAGANAAAAIATPTAPHRVRDRAASQIWDAYEAVRAYELVFTWADVETLHELRIASKWLRYTLEFFGETLGPDSGRLLQRVVALQDYLGCPAICSLPAPANSRSWRRPRSVPTSALASASSPAAAAALGRSGELSPGPRSVGPWAGPRQRCRVRVSTGGCAD
jgi:CHAD domain-containing protein